MATLKKKQKKSGRGLDKRFHKIQYIPSTEAWMLEVFGGREAAIALANVLMTKEGIRLAKEKGVDQELIDRASAQLNVLKLAVK